MHAAGAERAACGEALNLLDGLKERTDHFLKAALMSEEAGRFLWQRRVGQAI
jgi:hypothetical protein